jgi:hypothetical protein
MNALEPPPACWEEINRRLANLESRLGPSQNPECACDGAAAGAPGDCPHKQRLKATLLETIETLEQSKKAFHSRSLELLRGKLTRALAEIV